MHVPHLYDVLDVVTSERHDDNEERGETMTRTTSHCQTAVALWRSLATDDIDG